MNKSMKWFDLNRLGAALKVIPESPLRGVTVTCLEITDLELFQNARGLPDRAHLNEADRQRIREQWHEDLKSLKFSIQGQRVHSAKTNKVGLRFYSTQTEFTLSGLRRLVPGLLVEDCREMASSDIVLQSLPDVELSEQWSLFVQKVLAHESLGVWTPKNSSYNTTYDEARCLSKADQDLYNSKGRFELLGKYALLAGQHLLDRLASANYRENALISYFADQQAAEAAGWAVHDLKQVDMPYALPLWVDSQGQITALRDVRYAPEIMDMPPTNYYGLVESTGIVVPAIRAIRDIQPLYLEQIKKWETWVESPDTLNEAEEFRDSLTQVVIKTLKLSERYPQVTTTIQTLLDPSPPLFLGGSLHAKTVNELNSNDMNVLALNVSRILWDDDSAQPEILLPKLNKLLEHAQALEETKAKEHAQEALHRVIERIQAVPEIEKTKVKHVDTGEKIGGARKDYARRAMSIEDLDTMNDMEKKALVVKKNVWPPLDYEVMRENGVTARAAIAIKVLKDGLNTAPSRRRNYQGDFEADFVYAIGIVRDAVAEVKTLEDFARVCQQLCDKGREISPDVKSDYITGGTNLQVQWGEEVSRWLFAAHSEAMVPYKINHVVRRKAQDDADWSYLIKPKAQKSEAEVEADKEKSENERLLHRPHLAKVERWGHDWRQGRDIVAQDLIDHFGFRAVEFGNWLPQDERQLVLNMAFDSLCDLADALNIAPKGVSLGGELAVAFGSRGRGGKNAALAHFEPLRNVINLTRLNGAGTLAHEWMHALDFYLADRQGYLSDHSEKRNSFPGAMGKVVKSLKYRNFTATEMHERAWVKSQRGIENALSWLYGQSEQNRAALKILINERFRQVHVGLYQYAQDKLKYLASNPDDTVCSELGVIPRVIQIEKASELLRALKEGCEDVSKFSHVKGKIEKNLNWMMSHLSVAVTLDAAREMKADLPKAFFSSSSQCETNFYLEAKKLDKDRSTLYWSTTRELFARAGAAYIYDALTQKDIRSDYLVYGSDEAAHLAHPMGNPNPTGIDREMQSEHFSTLIDEYRLQCRQKNEAEAGMEL